MKRELLDLQQLQKYVEDVIACEALEICHFPEKAPGQIYIPYMMNDALEYYLILEDCSITGVDAYDEKDHTIEAWDREILSSFSENTRAEFVKDEKKNGIIIRDPGNKSLVLWYEAAYLISRKYQYHRIGHFWKAGMEQWRILVYMIGTVFDKFAFIGEESINDIEREFLMLITFAPFRYWSPISENLESYYPNSLAGIQAMKRYARKAGDRSYARWLSFYEFMYKLCFERGWRFLPMTFLDKKMARLLTRKERGMLRQTIYDAVREGSLKYPERDYGPDMEEAISKKRKEARDQAISKGFQGIYPKFTKDTPGKGYEELIAMEQHPFTFMALDYEDFDFEIKYMYSKAAKQEIYDHAGFFSGKDREGRILDDLSTL